MWALLLTVASGLWWFDNWSNHRSLLTAYSVHKLFAWSLALYLVGHGGMALAHFAIKTAPKNSAFLLRLLIYKPRHVFGHAGLAAFVRHVREVLFCSNSLECSMFTQVKIFITQLFCRIYFFIFTPVGPSDFIKPAPAGRWA